MNPDSLLWLTDPYLVWFFPVPNSISTCWINIGHTDLLSVLWIHQFGSARAFGQAVFLPKRSFSSSAREWPLFMLCRSWWNAVPSEVTSLTTLAKAVHKPGHSLSHCLIHSILNSWSYPAYLIYSLPISSAIYLNSARDRDLACLFTVLFSQWLANSRCSKKCGTKMTELMTPWVLITVLWVWFCVLWVYLYINICVYFLVEQLFSVLSFTVTCAIRKPSSLAVLYFCTLKCLAQHLTHGSWWIHVFEWKNKFVGNADESL